MQSLGKKQDQLLSSFEFALSSLEILKQSQYECKKKICSSCEKNFLVEIMCDGLRLFLEGEKCSKLFENLLNHKK